MPIEGYFKSGLNVLPAPYVDSIIQFPRLGIGGPVDFLIDTGADHTSIHPSDAAKLGVDYRRFRGKQIVNFGGIGGQLGYYPESGVLVCRDTSGDFRLCDITIYICQKSTQQNIEGLPSLIGRDVLSLCTLRIDKSINLVQLEPFHVDALGVILPPPSP